MSNKLYQYVTTPYIGRSVFNLSYEKKFTANMGKLYPVCCEEVVPGDTFKLGNRCVLRFMPTIAPVMHEINIYTHYFFVPYRLLWSHEIINNVNDLSVESGANYIGHDGIDAVTGDKLKGDWQTFITGGVSGPQVNDGGAEVYTPIPRLIPRTLQNVSVGSLWDYLGMPVDPALVVNTSYNSCITQSPDYDNYPIAFPFFAYNFIYNEFYRDENLQPYVAFDNRDILTRAWEKDYFTSALPWQQRGTSPALPVHTSINLPLSAIGDSVPVWASSGQSAVVKLVNKDAQNISQVQSAYTGPNADLTVRTTDLTSALSVNGDVVSSTFDVSDLRLAFQLQKWLERNARGGVRYTEFLKSHFAVSPRDERLQRPEYIGGTRQPVIMSEVLQTSQTDGTPQGTMAGHGISVGQSYAGTYHVKEYGIIMGIMSVMPRTQYQQGINRAWLRKSRYDYFFPEFQNLSEQAIEQGELYFTGNKAEDQKIFGYQGRYNEMRTRTNMTVGGMRDTFDYWHLGRKFNESPNLNGNFIKCIPSKRIFAVQDEDTLMVNFGNIIRATRPMVYSPEPGLIDHH